MRVDVMAFPKPLAQTAPTAQRTKGVRPKQNAGAFEDMAPQRCGAVAPAMSDRMAS